MEKRSLQFGLAAGGLALALFIAWAVPRSANRPRWTEDLKDENPAVRAAAVRGLARDSRPDLLIAALDDEDADVRLLAAQRVGDCEALARALGDSHGGVRREAARSLNRLRPAASPFLYQALQDNNPHIRAAAALALNRWCGSKDAPQRAPGEEKVILPLLCKLVRDPDDEVRLNAVQTLCSLPLRGPDARKQALPALRVAVKDSLFKVRETASHTLARLEANP